MELHPEAFLLCQLAYCEVSSVEDAGENTQEEGTFLPGSGILPPPCSRVPSEAYLPMSFNSIPQLAFKSPLGTLVGSFLVSFVATPVALLPFRGLTLYHRQRDLNFRQGWGEDCRVQGRTLSLSLLCAGGTPCYPQS